MPKKVYINGKFLSDRMQGIVRYAREMVNALDEIINKQEIELILLYPKNSHDIPNYKNIKTQQIGDNTGVKWEQSDLKSFVKKNKKSFCLNLCNVTPLGIQPGITTIHDIMYKTDKKNYHGLKNRLSALWHCYQYRYICKHEKQILTVSNYSKNLIEKYYPKSKGKITVTYNSWEHVKNYKENPEWNKKYPFLKEKEYFFSLATLAKNKNGKWIIEIAKKHPEYTFAIGGKFYNDSKMKEENIPSNVHLLGFLDDNDACSLIKNCKAFLFPSINEGFGLPPLEALALGATVISSNAASLPEILGDSVHYIDPYKYDYDLNELLKEQAADPKITLDKYSYRQSALIILGLLKQ